MAAISFGPKFRPCLWGGKKALFHCWFNVSEIVAPSIINSGHPGGVIAGILGLVEDENGHMHKVYPENIQFLDNGIFQEYCFTKLDVDEKENDDEHDELGKRRSQIGL